MANKAVESIAAEADAYAWTQFPDNGGIPQSARVQQYRDEKFAELVVHSIVADMQVEGSDFYHNEPNDYGCVTVKFFTGEGNPWMTMRGEEVMGNYVDGVRGTGRYRLNELFVKCLMEKLR